MLKRWLSRFHRKPKVTHTLTARVIRADGTVEDLGVVSKTKSKGWRVKSDG
jgi:hypothetical protein